MDTKKIQEAVKMIIDAVGEDGSREGLQETPERIAKMYQEIFAGLNQTAEVHLSKLNIQIIYIFNIFESNASSIFWN